MFKRGPRAPLGAVRSSSRTCLGRFGLDALVEPLLEVAAQVFSRRAKRVTRAPRLEAQDAYLLVTAAVAAGIALALRQRTHTHARTLRAPPDGVRKRSQLLAIAMRPAMPTT